MSHKISANPFSNKRLDYLSSHRRSYLKALYNGFVEWSVPYDNSTSGQYTRGEVPNKPASIPPVIFSTNWVIKRGCSFIPLKNLTQFFYANIYTVGLFVSTYRKLPRVSIFTLRTAQRSILRRSTSARLKIADPPTNDTCTGPKHEKITLP